MGSAPGTCSVDAGDAAEYSVGPRPPTAANSYLDEIINSAEV